MRDDSRKAFLVLVIVLAKLRERERLRLRERWNRRKPPLVAAAAVGNLRVTPHRPRGTSGAPRGTSEKQPLLGTWLRAGRSVSENFPTIKIFLPKIPGFGAEVFPTITNFRPVEPARFFRSKNCRIEGRRFCWQEDFPSRRKRNSARCQADPVACCRARAHCAPDLRVVRSERISADAEVRPPTEPSPCFFPSRALLSSRAVGAESVRLSGLLDMVFHPPVRSLASDKL